MLRLKGGASGVLSHRNDGGHDLLAVAGCVSLDHAGERHALQKFSRGPVEVLHRWCVRQAAPPRQLPSPALRGVDVLVHRLDDRGGGNVARRSAETVPAARTANARNEPCTAELAEDLLEIGHGDLLAFGICVREMGASSSCRARSTMAVTANRPLVVSFKMQLQFDGG